MSAFLQSDADGRDVFLLTGRSHGFYETVGFSIVGEGLLGKSNPKWEEEPVPCYLASNWLSVLDKSEADLRLQ